MRSLWSLRWWIGFARAAVTYFWWKWYFKGALERHMKRKRERDRLERLRHPERFKAG